MSTFWGAVYIASVLYLRRVLEGIVKNIAKDYNIDLEKKKMLGELIEKIKKHLPNFIKMNIKKLSFILGETIHNLNEEKAQEEYNNILNFINLIIDKIKYEKNQKQKEKELDKWINNYDK